MTSPAPKAARPAISALHPPRLTPSQTMVKPPASYPVSSAPPLPLALYVFNTNRPQKQTPPLIPQLLRSRAPRFRVAPLAWLPYPLCPSSPGPRGSPRPTWPPPPKGGGISGVARDVATCAAEAACVNVRGGGVLREGGGRGPTGGDITLVPLSPPTPLKNPEPVSLPPSRPPKPFPSVPTTAERSPSWAPSFKPQFFLFSSLSPGSPPRLPGVPAGREPAPLPGPVH